MSLEFDTYKPDKLFSGSKRVRAFWNDRERIDRDMVLRWVTSAHRPYDLPPEDPMNLFFETDEMHRMTGIIELDRMTTDMPFFSAIVRMDRVKNIWHGHDDGEAASGKLSRNGFQFLELNNFQNPFRKFQGEQPGGVFIADMATINGDSPDQHPVPDNETVVATLFTYERYKCDYPAPKKKVRKFKDVDPHEAQQFAIFEEMVEDYGGFFDYLDIHSSRDNPQAYVDPDMSIKIKQAFHYLQARNPANPAAVFLSQLGSFDKFEKTLYESYDYFGYLDDLMIRQQPAIDDKTCYKRKLLNFWYTIPLSVEGLTAKWLDKYVGLLVGLQGPFNWEGRDGTTLTSPRKKVEQHLVGSFGSLFYYYRQLREQLRQYPQAQHELDIKTARLLNTFVEAGYTNIPKDVSELYNSMGVAAEQFPALSIPDARIADYNFYNNNTGDLIRRPVVIKQKNFTYTNSRLFRRKLCKSTKLELLG